MDWVAASFVQRPRDVLLLREAIAGRAGLVTKLEKPSAIEQLDEIIELSDAVMVARGDLGVELPPEDVPSISRRIVRACRSAGKPVIVATQMLESMVSSPVPTRAEASDVATAIYDGADAVMLSGETAVGRYPVEAVDIMHRIIARVERDPHYREQIDAALTSPKPTAADAISDAMRRIAQTLSVAAAVTYTSSGSSSLRAARERPSAPVLSLTPHMSTARRLALVWGPSLRAEQGRRTRRGDGRPGVPHRGHGGVRERRRPPCHHGGDAVRDLGDDEHAPDRACAVPVHHGGGC